MSYMPDSDRGIDRSALADGARDLDFENGRRKSMAPMQYEVAVLREGDVIEVVEFECSAPERTAEMLKRGINPDNDTIARRSRSHELMQWPKAIGDSQLSRHLDKR